MKIYCCPCEADVDCRLVTGKDVYPHRKDLASVTFWRHDKCGNFVGTHHKSMTPLKPLGCIPTKDVKAYRQKIHSALDPLWKTGAFNRKEVYRKISKLIGTDIYHTAEIRTVDEARKVLEAIETIERENNR